ncbi:MAG: hypothetical protein WBX15_12455 [Thermoanaerobaculia bacterium]
MKKILILAMAAFVVSPLLWASQKSEQEHSAKSTAKSTEKKATTKAAKESADQRKAEDGKELPEIRLRAVAPASTQAPVISPKGGSSLVAAAAAGKKQRGKSRISIDDSMVKKAHAEFTTTDSKYDPTREYEAEKQDQEREERQKSLDRARQDEQNAQQEIAAKQRGEKIKDLEARLARLSASYSDEGNDPAATQYDEIEKEMQQIQKEIEDLRKQKP